MGRGLEVTAVSWESPHTFDGLGELQELSGEFLFGCSWPIPRFLRSPTLTLVLVGVRSLVLSGGLSASPISCRASGALVGRRGGSSFVRAAACVLGLGLGLGVSVPSKNLLSVQFVYNPLVGGL